MYKPEVVHSGLESKFPSVEVHRAHLAEVWLCNVNVQTLTLIDESSSVRRHFEDRLLADLPDRLVQGLDVVWNLGNTLDGAVGRDDLILDIVAPEI